MNIELTKTLDYDEGVEKSVPSKFSFVADLPKSHPNNEAFCELSLLPRDLVGLIICENSSALRSITIRVDSSTQDRKEAAGT